MDSSSDAEALRLSALASYDVLDTNAEADFDGIVRLAAQICETPIALVSLVDTDRQWFKATVGLAVDQTPLCDAVCAHAILETDLLIIPDLTLDSRTADNNLVVGDPGIRFYAGAVLRNLEGYALGTLCVIDYQPRPNGLDEKQCFGLQMLARQTMAQLELRRTARIEREVRQDREEGRLRFEAIFNSAVDYAIIVMDRDGCITDWNEGATRILGWTPDEIIGHDVSAFFTPEDCAAGIPDREMEHALSQGRGIDERWHLRKSGERFWANGEMMPLRDAHGSLIGFMKVLRDRTQARLAEEQLVASEKRWRELFENMREGFFLGELLRDGNGKATNIRLLEANDAFTEQSGLPRTSVGRTIDDFPGHLPQALIDRFVEAVETGEPQRFEIHVPDLHRWFEVRGAKDEGERFSCLFLDITARKAIEEQLVLNDERLQMALTASGAVGLWDWMVETDLLHGDASFARLYGLDVVETAAGITMEQYQRYVVPEDIGPLREHIAAVFERGEDFLVEYRLAIPGEPLRWVECKGRMVADSEGRPFRFSGTAVDVTIRKNAESQKHLLMEELSHRVKNTFAMVQAVVFQTLRGTDPAVSDTLQSRLAALSRAHEILLQKSWTSMTISALLDRVLRLEAEGDRYVIDGPNFEVGPEAALSISLLLHELATNAVKYGALSNETGIVRVTWQKDDGHFRLFWTEEGGPPARTPERKGFGSRLVGLGIRNSRKADLTFDETGFRATFEVDYELVAADGGA